MMHRCIKRGASKISLSDQRKALLPMLESKELVGMIEVGECMEQMPSVSADASRLMKWVIGDTPVVRTGHPEQSVRLATPVAVYITYLTAQWDGAKLSFLDDPYGRDSSGSNRLAAKSAADAR